MTKKFIEELIKGGNNEKIARAIYHSIWFRASGVGTWNHEEALTLIGLLTKSDQVYQIYKIIKNGFQTKFTDPSRCFYAVEFLSNRYEYLLSQENHAAKQFLKKFK